MNKKQRKENHERRVRQNKSNRKTKIWINDKPKHLPYGVKDMGKTKDADGYLILRDRGTIKQKVKKEVENQLEDC